jgi:hypothetical protein
MKKFLRLALCAILMSALLATAAGCAQDKREKRVQSWFGVWIRSF